jgi:hypothetical protein
MLKIKILWPIPNLIFFHLILDSPYRKYFSAQILKLQESGVLSALKEKWWKNTNGTGLHEIFIFSIVRSHFLSKDVHRLRSHMTISILETLVVFSWQVLR